MAKITTKTTRTHSNAITFLLFYCLPIFRC
jgi:hypothetical protein